MILDPNKEYRITFWERMQLHMKGDPTYRPHWWTGYTIRDGDMVLDEIEMLSASSIYDRKEFKVREITNE